jgi:hypothetical protein
MKKKYLLIGDGSVFIYINWISISFLKTKKKNDYCVSRSTIFFVLYIYIYMCLYVHMNEHNTKEKEKEKERETDQHVNVDP